MWLHQWQIFNTLSKHKSSDGAKTKVLRAKHAMAKAKAVMLKAHRMKHQQTNTKDKLWLIRCNEILVDAIKAFDVEVHPN